MEVARTTSFSAEEWEAYERAGLAEQDARGALAVVRQESRQSGVVEGKLAALLRLFSRRGITLTDAERARVVMYSEERTIDRRFDRALVAAPAADAHAL